MNYEITTDKFHKVILSKYRIRRLKPKEQTIRNLLCYYLSLACEEYPTEEKFSIFQEEGYDMRYSVALRSIGNYSILSYTLSAVDPKFIHDTFYTHEFLEHSFNTCMKPLIKDNNFDTKLFKKAKEIYLSNLLYLGENESRRAINQTLRTYFKGTVRDFSTDGEAEVLSKISCKKLYTYYLSTLKDESESYAVGDVAGKYSIINDFDIAPKKNHFFIKRGICDDKIICSADTKQTYLEIIYDCKVFSKNKEFYAVSFLNYAFGGCSNSKLFQIVREKYGLCYSISSNYFGASGIILLSAIIDYTSLNKTLEAIDEAFNDLLNNFSLQDIKDYFLLERSGRKDYLASYLSETFMDKNFIDSIPSCKEVEFIQEVTMQDVKKAYKKLKRSLIYVYGNTKEQKL